MSVSQVQIKVSLSQQLNNLLKSKAQRLGVPVTQLVKHIIKEVGNEEYPTFIASDNIERLSKKALKELDKSLEVKDLDDFFRNRN